MTKAFPLYDDLATLCNTIIAMGVGAFRATCEVSSDCDVEGSSDDQDKVDWQASEEECLDLDDFPMSISIFGWMLH